MTIKVNKIALQFRFQAKENGAPEKKHNIKVRNIYLNQKYFPGIENTQENF